MDPNACLRDIEEFLNSRQTGEEVDEWCQNLFDWLQGGGFSPD